MKQVLVTLTALFGVSIAADTEIERSLGNTKETCPFKRHYSNRGPRPIPGYNTKYVEDGWYSPYQQFSPVRVEFTPTAKYPSFAIC